MATTIVCDEKIYQANSNLRQLLTDKRFTMRIDKLETRTMKLRDEIQLDKCSFLHFHSAKPINVTLHKTDGSKINFSASILTCDFDIKSAILSNINDIEVLTYLVYGVSGKEISYSSPVYYGALNYNSPDERDILELEKSISIKKNLEFNITADDQFPCIAIPANWGYFDIIKDRNGFDITTSFLTNEIELTQNGRTETYIVYTLETPTTVDNYKFSFIYEGL